MKAIIKIGYRCNDRCLFCHARGRSPDLDSAERVEAKIDQAALLKHSMVVFSGGEPTVHPDILRFAGHARKRGIAHGLITNGRALSNRSLLETLLDSGLGYAYVSLHGGSAKTHDEICGPGAFVETLAGIENLSGKGIDLTINCVVNARNTGRLREWVDLVRGIEGARLKLSMTEPKGAAAEDFDEIVPHIARAAEAVRDAIEYGAGLDPDRRIMHDAFPLCLLPGLENRYDDLWTHEMASMSEASEDCFFPVDDDDKLHPPACRDCRLVGACPGLYRSYYERLGDSELRPLPGPRSNSFNLVPGRLWTWRRGEPCPVLGLTSHLDRSRSLFLRNGERLTLFRTRSRDFSREELFRIKYELGQLYVDTGKSSTIEDFSADLRKIGGLEVCSGCPSLPHCPGGYRVRPEDLFHEEERILGALLSSFRGELLDLGCGESPYFAILEDLSKSGRIVYRGVDPDEDLISGLQGRWPWAILEAGRAEEQAPSAKSLDHVTLFRSYNHLEDPKQVISRMASALRPGGTLTIVDNTAFGLLRAPSQAARAESGRGRFEHLRNAGADEPAAILSSLGLCPILRRDVSKESANQWLLHYRKAGD